MNSPAPVLDLIEAFRRSKTMFAAVSLGVFDSLSAQPEGAPEIAARLHLDPDALERLLDGNVALGLLRKNDGIYSTEPVAAKYLTRGSPDTLAGYILYSNEALYRLWANLEDAVREGSHRWTQTFDLEGPLFDHFFHTPERMETFIQGMHGFGLLSSPAVAAAFDLSRFASFVDLGGATGHLVISACERYPNLRGVVFDLPKVTPVARATVAKSNAHARIEVVPGNFFDDPLPPSDLFAVARILHDWTEPKIERLLAKIYAALPAGGALLIAEKLMDEDKTGPLPANMQSLNMLCCTEGKERSLSEYRTILERAGFRDIEGRRTGTLVDAVIAFKPS